MKHAIETLQKELTRLHEARSQAEQADDDDQVAELQLQIDQVDLALDILKPIDAATSSELERWQSGYQSLRNHCIANEYDIGQGGGDS